jgi:ERCC4-related helicase
MEITQYHAKYFAFELTKRVSSDSVEKLASALVDAQVDLNPHQVEAALFAFKSPLSKGAILADEVGLGKTIEAGLVLSQKWAEKKRRILIISPANLRKQWSQELKDKFFINTEILENKFFNTEINRGNLNPFDQVDRVTICSYQFAKSKAPYIRHIKWDLVIIDEAHRLRNVYKPGNVTARTLKQTLEPFPKILLTATPLQNSLQELYGLVSIVDDHLFGDIKSFKAQYSRMEQNGDESSFKELKERIKTVTHRTLRRQVLEYIQFTPRKAFVFEFYPSDAEHQLYNLVSAYLQREKLYALPPSQRKLMTLVLRKLLASSSFAISGTFRRLQEKLHQILQRHQLAEPLDMFLEQEYEDFDELRDEWDGEETPEAEREWFDAAALLEIEEEAQLLGTFAELAESIQANSKGEKLLAALDAGFTEGGKKGAPKKAIIFTESRRTQNYLEELLRMRGYDGKIVLFNGSNSDAESKRIYNNWIAKNAGSDRITESPTADMRAALVDYFKHEAEIMIATEAAAEGINLQFCSIVVNYDMPWNPQRIEQRIGRCHRYGQKNEVIVINFLNKRNAADERVYQLLNEKFKLFDGVFGASDQVLGSIESGVDIERRIAQIYQECKTAEEIHESFNLLQKELEDSINDQLQVTKQKLLENFDEEVHEKLRLNMAASRDYVSKYENMLWKLTKFSLGNRAIFNEDNFTFSVNGMLNGHWNGHFKLGKGELPNHQHFRIQHPLAESILKMALEKQLPTACLRFDYSGSEKKISVFEDLVGLSGWIQLAQLKIHTFQEEDYLLAFGIMDSMEPMDSRIINRFFSLGAEVLASPALPHQVLSILQKGIDGETERAIVESQDRNGRYFQEEYEKLDFWAEDMKLSLEKEIKDLDAEIKLKKSESRRIMDLKEKINLQRQIKDLEKSRNEKRRKLFESQDDIDNKKEKLLNDIELQMNQKQQLFPLFTIRWELK